MYFLYLNPMRGRAEEKRLVAWAETRVALIAFLERERVAPYRDHGAHRITHDTDMLAQIAGVIVVEHIDQHQWAKAFRAGGPLEWFNPPFSEDEAIFELSLEQEIAKMTDSWNRMLTTTPHV